MPLQDKISKIARGIDELFPSGLAKDFKSNVEAIIRSNLEDLDFVTADQLVVQKRIVERALKRIQELEQRIEELEAVTNMKEGVASKTSKSADEG